MGPTELPPRVQGEPGGQAESLRTAACTGRHQDRRGGSPQVVSGERSSEEQRITRSAICSYPGQCAPGRRGGPGQLGAGRRGSREVPEHPQGRHFSRDRERPRLHCAVLNTEHAHPVPGGLAVGPWQVPVSHPVGSGHPQVHPGGRTLRPHSLGCTGLSLSSGRSAQPRQCPASLELQNPPRPAGTLCGFRGRPCLGSHCIRVNSPQPSPDTALPSFLPKPCSSQEARSCMEGPPARGTASQPSVL